MTSQISRTTGIERVHAREVFDSRGKPTVEVEVTCLGGRLGAAIVPSGASTGQFEACELRDGDHARLDGLGVRRAVENVREILGPAILGMDAADQAALDARLCELDGTPNKSKLGANAILGVSLAAGRAAAAARQVPYVEHLHELWKNVPAAIPSLAIPPDAQPFPPDLLGTQMVLPLPMINMISGGLHAGRNLDFQDFLILPVGAASYRESLDWTIAVYRHLGRLLTAAGLEGVLVGDEGGYGPKLSGNEEALEFIVRAIETAGFEPGQQVAIGLDVASTHFYHDGRYHLTAGGPQDLSAGDLVDLLERWVDRYPIISIEDGVADDDRDGWRKLTQRLGTRVQLIGDDLFVTHPGRLECGIDEELANSVLIKVNQVGTLSETFRTLRLALDAGYWPVVSARSGETEDPFLADLAVATGAGQIKIGSVARSERLAKYNQLLRLEERLGQRALWRGGSIFESLSAVRNRASGSRASGGA